ncbi:hypothetical protein [Thioclava atlantica]|uniref:Uncharacterized protein n=1 Tax=Thioclava atlantica TaxID=1317124 RepID=A0A085TRR7_9RHOB|nr:hypothetical protein [Thioclava atlantica]KFE33414.1 hypothetical protein DW2_17904 [Thioclava atlantica]
MRNSAGFAQGVQAPANLSEQELVAWAAQANVCKGSQVLSAGYENGAAKIVCAPGGGQLSPANPAIAVIVAVGLAAAAMGGGNGTNGTNGTN